MNEHSSKLFLNTLTIEFECEDLMIDLLDTVVNANHPAPLYGAWEANVRTASRHLREAIKSLHEARESLPGMKETENDT